MSHIHITSEMEDPTCDLRTRSRQPSREESRLAREEFERSLRDAQAETEKASAKTALMIENLNEVKTLFEGAQTEIKKVGLKYSKSAAEVAEMRDMMAFVAEDSFNNALAQVRCVNARIALNTEGLHFQSFVRDGAIVSLEQEDSVIEVEDTSEAGVEADSAPTGGV